jgi:hypothetical protein
VFTIKIFCPFLTQVVFWISITHWYIVKKLETEANELTFHNRNLSDCLNQHLPMDIVLNCLLAYCMKTELYVELFERDCSVGHYYWNHQFIHKCYFDKDEIKNYTTDYIFIIDLTKMLDMRKTVKGNVVTRISIQKQCPSRNGKEYIRPVNIYRGFVKTMKSTRWKFLSMKLTWQRHVWNPHIMSRFTTNNICY